MFRTVDYDSGEKKYVGSFKGVVLDNRDPLKAGRVVVEHPLLGETVWIPYLKLPSTYDVPRIGDIVYVECDAGYAEFPIAWGNLGKRNADSSDTSPETFQREVPTNRGMYSPQGHLIEMDDGEANDSSVKDDTDLSTTGRALRFTSSEGHKVHLLDDTDAQQSGILFEDSEGNKLFFDASNKKMTLNSVGDKSITVAGNINETVDGDFTGKASGNFTYEAIKVYLGQSASVHATISENLIALYDEHQHPTIPPLVGGPVLPPNVPMASKAGTALDPTALFIFIKGNS